MKYFLILAVLLFATPAFSYGYYNSYTVVGNDQNSTGYVQQVGSSYYGIGNGRFTSNTGSTYEKHGNVIQEVNGKRYVQMGNVLYED